MNVELYVGAGDGVFSSSIEAMSIDGARFRTSMVEANISIICNSGKKKAQPSGSYYK
jgi:hypothetical protein